jgi:transcriptional regulator with XRE-family HTH domain
VAEKAAASEALAVTVNARFKEEQKRLKLTQEKLAGMTSISQSSISRFGRERSLKLESLLVLLDTCARRGMDLSYVFGGVRLATRIKAETGDLAHQIVSELLPQLQAYVGPRAGKKQR